MRYVDSYLAEFINGPLDGELRELEPGDRGYPPEEYRFPVRRAAVLALDDPTPEPPYQELVYECFRFDTVLGTAAYELVR